MSLDFWNYAKLVSARAWRETLTSVSGSLLNALKAATPAFLTGVLIWLASKSGMLETAFSDWVFSLVFAIVAYLMTVPLIFLINLLARVPWQIDRELRQQIFDEKICSQMATDQALLYRQEVQKRFSQEMAAIERTKGLQMEGARERLCHNCRGVQREQFGSGDRAIFYPGNDGY